MEDRLPEQERASAGRGARDDDRPDEHHNYVGNNVVRRNPEDGIILQGDDNQIVGNRVVRNSITITLFTNDAHAVGNVVRRNHVRRAPAAG